MKEDPIVPRDSARRSDWWLIALISVVVLCVTLGLTFRLITQSEKHVKEVRKVKVSFEDEKGWMPSNNQIVLAIKKDLKEDPFRKEAKYFQFELSEEAAKLIGKFSRLETLSLGQTDMRDSWLLHIDHLNLRSLDVYGTRITNEGLKTIAKMKSLEELNLGATDIDSEGLKELKKLPKLHLLILSGTAIDDQGLEYLKDCKSLRTLKVDETKISDRGLATVASMNELTFLDLSFMKLNEEGLENLGKMHLTRLILLGCGIEDSELDPIAGMTSLAVLSLQANDITDSGLKKLYTLKNLVLLNLDGCSKVSDEGIAQLRKKLPNCKVTHLASHRPLDLIEPEMEKLNSTH